MKEHNGDLTVTFCGCKVTYDPSSAEVTVGKNIVLVNNNTVEELVSFGPSTLLTCSLPANSQISFTAENSGRYNFNFKKAVGTDPSGEIIVNDPPSPPPPVC
ncbi:hypothetical protein [Aliikangiella sp. IMCC44359]|uniref:hypothetical protein n=1 Tax=Aliikangiella sp. IMCC44359 TaxID=3459125 RepID=UPI00403B1DE9